MSNLIDRIVTGSAGGTLPGGGTLR
jgi:hypothetical protein